MTTTATNRGQNDNRGHCDQRNDNRNHRDNRDRWRDRCDDYRGKRPHEDDHEVNAIKKPSGHRDYQNDYNKALKGPCQLHPKSNHTMENYRFLKNIYASRLPPMTPQGLTPTHNDEMLTTTMTNRIEILITNTSLPPKSSIPSLAERCL
jgi:hypothetical protein